MGFLNRLLEWVAPCALVAAIAVGACNSTNTSSHAGADASGAGGQAGGITGTGGAGDGAMGGSGGAMCSYPDGSAPVDGAAFNGVCPQGGCPAGTVCVFEVGGVAGGGGEYCAPIPNECHGTPTCACMASCACTNGRGGRPEVCSERNGSIACNNGIT